MRLDDKTKGAIIEILATSMLEYEEYLIGRPENYTNTVKERAIKRYNGPRWEPDDKIEPLADRFLDFRRRVKSAAYALFNAIEGPDPEQIYRDMMQMQVETIEALNSIRKARREQAIRNLAAQFDPKTITPQQIYDETERLGRIDGL